jgi:hypothetical protein
LHIPCLGLCAIVALTRGPSLPSKAQPRLEAREQPACRPLSFRVPKRVSRSLGGHVVSATCRLQVLLYMILVGIYRPTMADHQSTQEKRRTRSQRKRVFRRRLVRRRATRATNQKRIWTGRIEEFVRDYEDAEKPTVRWSRRIVYERLDGRRQRITLYVRAQDIIVVFRRYFGPLYVTADGTNAVLPHPEHPTIPITKLLTIAKEFGITSLPVHPLYSPPQTVPRPRLLKAPTA